MFVYRRFCHAILALTFFNLTSVTWTLTVIIQIIYYHTSNCVLFVTLYHVFDKIKTIWFQAEYSSQNNQKLHEIYQWLVFHETRHIFVSSWWYDFIISYMEKSINHFLWGSYHWNCSNITWKQRFVVILRCSKTCFHRD